jgi:hypothetical protein
MGMKSTGKLVVIPKVGPWFGCMAAPGVRQVRYIVAFLTLRGSGSFNTISVAVDAAVLRGGLSAMKRLI